MYVIFLEYIHVSYGAAQVAMGSMGWGQVFLNYVHLATVYVCVCVCVCVCV